MIKYILGFLCLCPIWLNAQVDPRLADYYYQNGEMEKAVTLYEKLAEQNGGDYYFERYVTCLSELQRYDQAEKVLTRQIKKEPSKSGLYISYGAILERQDKAKEAAEQYKKAIEKLPADRNVIESVATLFKNRTNNDLALQTYERGAVLLKDKYVFAFNMADLYRRKDNVPRMVECYLDALISNERYLSAIQTMLLRNATAAEDQVELQTQLYARIQDKPDVVVYPELLAWVFMQKKDYKNAFRQLKAVDRLNAEEGNRVFNLATIAEGDRDYDAAIEGYNYLIKEKGPQSFLYIESYRNLLACKRKKLTDGYTFTRAELESVEKDYETFLATVGQHARTASIMAELADLEAFYLKNLDKAVSILETIIDLPQVNRDIQSRAKLSLGDLYLIKGERWDATLLYSQVDKLYKDDILGHDARFKNAKLSYYFGDFDWAKAQFAVLKASTSKLISNDAIEMDLFIMDNTQDSITEPLKAYAEAELLVFQNRFDEALLKLDSLFKDNPETTLNDDIVYLKGQMYKKQKLYDKAIEAFDFIVSKYKKDESIRVDNALYEMAELYENRLNNPEKAKTLYEQLFTDYSDSVLAVEARKRFRILRGDKLGRNEQ